MGILASSRILAVLTDLDGLFHELQGGLIVSATHVHHRRVVEELGVQGHRLLVVAIGQGLLPLVLILMLRPVEVQRLLVGMQGSCSAWASKSVRWSRATCWKWDTSS